MKAVRWMIDRDKVIKEFEHLLNAANGNYQDFVDLTVDVGKEILAMLKEQEAKPVIVTTNAYGTKFYHCPRCNRDLYVYPRQLYCSNCGQAVKYDD